jgi:acyl-coenzyme A synthetase/AMP-(fatty) acid ligase
MVKSVWYAGTTYGTEELAQIVSAIRPSAEQSRCRLAIHSESGPSFAALIGLFSDLNLSCAILPSELAGPAIDGTAAELGCSHVLRLESDSDDIHIKAVEGFSIESSAPTTPGVILFTSGSTGKPKKVEHAWGGLKESVHENGRLAEARWMSMYPLCRFAGFNTLLHAIANSSALVIPKSLRPDDILEAAEVGRPTHISGTPTLWKVLLMEMKPAAWTESVQQITLGGETVDQPVLSALHLRFPNAKISHIYASTEAGVCLVVSDGRAGFPSKWLSDTHRSVQIEIRSGFLYVRRVTGASSALLTDAQDGWWSTGDMVEIRGDRVYFLGRDTDLLSVGGAKIAPALVEERLREVPGVVDARVLGRKSALAGTILVAQVISPGNQTEPQLRRDLISHCRQMLPSYAVPRIFEFVNALPVARSGKLKREDA